MGFARRMSSDECAMVWVRWALAIRALELCPHAVLERVGRSGRGCLKIEGYLIRETAGWTLGIPPLLLSDEGSSRGEDL